MSSVATTLDDVAGDRRLLPWALLLLLTAMWGSAFMLTKVAVTSLPPGSVVTGRLWVGAVALVTIMLVARRRLPRGLRPWLYLLGIAVVGNLLPFNLITWGQQHIDSSLAGILMAVMPLVTLVLAHFFVDGERLSPARVGGFLLGLVGVVILMGPASLGGVAQGGPALVAQLAVLGGALCYGIASILSRLSPTRDALAAGTGVLIVSALLMLPLSPPVAPGVDGTLPVAAAGAVLVLGLLSTALATVVYFKLIRMAGPAFVSLINYLIPLWAVALGIVFLGEQPRLTDMLALIVILSGIALSQRRGR